VNACVVPCAIVALAGVIVIELKVAGPLGAEGEVVLELEPPPQLASNSKLASTGTNNTLRIIFTSSNKEEGTIACAGHLDDESWVKKRHAGRPLPMSTKDVSRCNSSGDHLKFIYF
jgi:hypothetical protein